MKKRKPNDHKLIAWVFHCNLVTSGASAGNREVFIWGHCICLGELKRLRDWLTRAIEWAEEVKL